MQFEKQFCCQIIYVRPINFSVELDLLPGFVSFIVGLFYELEMGIFFGQFHILIVILHYEFCLCVILSWVRLFSNNKPQEWAST